MYNVFYANTVAILRGFNYHQLTFFHKKFSNFLLQSSLLILKLNGVGSVNKTAIILLLKGKKRLHTPAYLASTYPSFCSLKRLGVFLLLPGWDVRPPQG